MGRQGSLVRSREYTEGLKVSLRDRVGQEMSLVSFTKRIKKQGLLNQVYKKVLKMLTLCEHFSIMTWF